MKRRRTKLRKFLLRFLLFFLLFTGLSAVLLRSRSVQTYLGGRAGDYLGKELGCTIRIKALEFDFFSNLRLEGVYISDQQGDSMISAGAIIARLKKFDNANRYIAFSSTELINTLVRLGHYKGVPGTNIDFLVDYINGPPRKTKTKRKPQVIVLGDARLTNTRFHYFDERGAAPEPGVLDNRHLEFNRINGLAENFEIIGDSFHFRAVDWSMLERSGLDIRSFNALCNIHDLGMDFDDLLVKMPCSLLQGELHFSYPGFKYLDEFETNTRWRGKLRNSTICMDELSIFDRMLEGHPDRIAINADIDGTFEKMQLKRVDARIGKKTRVKGDFFFDGLPDWRTTYCDFNIGSLSTDLADLNQLLMGAELPEFLGKAGVFSFNGTFTGQFLDFKLNGEMNSALGNLSADAFMNFKEGMSKAEYAGRFISEGLDIGTLFGVTPQVGRMAFDMDVDGRGLTPNTFGLKVDAVLPMFELRERSFSDAQIVGDLTSRNFTGKAFFKDSRLNLSFDGNIDFTGASPVFNFTTVANGTDLYELGLDTVHTLVYGTTVVNWSGLDPINAEGSIAAQNLAIHRRGRVYQYAFQEVSKRNEQVGTRISFRGDLVNGFVSGNYNPASIPVLAQNAIAQVFPEKISAVAYTGLDSFQFSLAISETGLLTSLISDDFTTTGVNLNGFLNAGKGTMELLSAPVNLCWGQFSLDQISLSARKSDSSNLDFRVNAATLLVNDTAWFNNLSLTGDACRSKADFEFRMRDARWNEEIDLVAESYLSKDSLGMKLGKSQMRLLHNDWEVGDEAYVSVLNDQRVHVSDFYFQGKNTYVEINGYLSGRQTDTLRIDAGNLTFDNVRPFIPSHGLDSFNGVFNATVFVSSVFDDPHIWGDVAGRNLRYNGFDYGGLNVSLREQGEAGRLGLEGRFTKGPIAGLSALGSIAYEAAGNRDQFDVDFNLPAKTSLRIAQPFLQDILTIEDGTVQGLVHLGGNPDKPKLTGGVAVRNGRFMVDYLKTRYSMSMDIEARPNGFFTKGPVRLVDETGQNSATASMAITHKDFSSWYLDLKIDSARNLKVLNTTEKDDDLYYGTGYADGGCRIYGPFDRISMDVKLKTRKNTQLFLMYSDVEENTVGGFVKFRDHFGKQTSKEKARESSSIYRINIEVEATPDAEAQFVIDKRLGDIIRGKGSGKLRMLYDENGQFFLYGTYTVNEGDYVFSLPGINVLTRKIALDKGGTIAWDGDPFNAILNMTGSFEKKISPAALMYSVSSSSNKNYAATRVVSKLFMKGNLFSPDLSFDIQVPDIQSSGGASASEVYSVIQRIRTDKDETMRQAVALLLFGNFIPPTFAANTGANILSGSGVAGNSLSSIASTVVNDLFSKFGIPTRIQVNIDDVRSSTGTNTKVFISSEWFLTERLRLDVNYDPTVAMVVSNVALPLNFNLEYMTRNENWRIKAFSRSNNLLLQQNASTITNGVSGNTLGGGVVYRREFNSFRPKKAKTTTAAPQ